jgi:hypothetical protein
MDQTGAEFFMKSYCGSGNSRSQGHNIFCRARRGWAAGAAPPWPGRRGRGSGAGPLGPRLRSWATGPGCRVRAAGTVAVKIFCGSGTLCSKKLCQVLFSGTDSPSLKMGMFCRQVLFSGTDSPSLKMGMFCRKFAEDVLS